MDTAQATQLIETFENSARRFETSWGDGRMVWRKWGEGRPVVLLHGGAGSWMHWIRNLGALSARQEVWVPDMPGFGDSDVPFEGKVDADGLAPLVRDGIRELLGDRRFALVGFSFGSLVATAIAAEPPAALDRLVLVSASALGLFQGPAPLQPLRGVTDPEERRRIVRFNLNAMMLHDPSTIDDLAILVQKKSAPRDRIKNRQLARTDYLVRTAPSWTRPAYGIWGRQDYAYRDQFPRLQEVVSGLGLREAAYIDGGHWLPFENPEQFNPLLQRMLDAAD
ncbi:alpha/beta fold hydrolase [Pigmentiphaga soli]|uniref:Alpha/beta fold hydrolase n=1 Tax=Pigmentiphaga soli TaxID=1007095 RepID=A0ABP8HDN7_9BURK